MRRESRLSIFLSAVLICSLIPTLPSVTAQDIFDHNLGGEIINQGDSLDIDLGLVNEGDMIRISFLASEDVDVIMLTESQYNSWNGQDYIVNGSEIDTDIIFEIDNEKKWLKAINSGFIRL